MTDETSKIIFAPTKSKNHKNLRTAKEKVVFGADLDVSSNKEVINLKVRENKLPVPASKIEKAPIKESPQ